MNDELRSMLKKTFLIDVIAGLILGIIIGVITNVSHALILVLGLLISYVSFYVNTITTSYGLEKQKKGLIMLSLLGRMIVIVAVGAVLFMFNKYFVLTYMLGYSSHFISIIIYGVALRDN